MPKAIALADGGIKRFSDADSDIAVARMGDSFIIYDYDSGKVTRSLTRGEVNAELAKYRNARAATAQNMAAQSAAMATNENATTTEAVATSEVGAEVNANEGTGDIWEKGVTEADRKAATEARKQAAELDSYAKEHVKDYEHLSVANKTMVRDVIREGRAKGLSDAIVRSYARVSARSGLDITFDKAACLATDKNGKPIIDKEGNEVYHAGYYDPNENKIVVNPETTKKHAALLIHELSHATRAFTANDGKIHYIFDKTAYAKMSEDMQKELLSYYSKQKVDVSIYELIGDEATAYYAEALFGTERAIELLLGEKPTLSEKILSFFKGAARDYATDPALAREARRQLRQFKALFDSFSARNFGRNAEGGESNGSYRASMNIGDEKVNVTLDEDKDLVAIHNLTEKNLLDTLELGGFPMPSIAIIRKGQEHSKYGDISVVFGRETIDPKNSKYNKVYGGDAWTATYPRIEYKANEKVANRINDKYYELEKKYGYDNVRAMYAYANELEERLNGLKGEEGLLEEIYDSTRMMQVYLLDTGKGRVETVTKEIRKEMTPREVNMNEFFIKELGEEFIDAYKAPNGASPFTYVKEYVKENEGRIKEAFTKYLTEEANIDPGVVEKVVEQYKPGDYAKLLRDAYRYRHEGAVTVKVEDDPKATEAAIRKAADNEQYREWVDSLFKGAQEKTGIRNSKNYYDNYGNSRSWEQLHYENTIDNVIRVMREQVETGGQTIFSGNSIWGVAAKEYNSIDEVKADKERLKKLPEEEYKAMAEELGGRLEKIAQSIKSDSESNVFIAVDDVMSLIVDCVRECKTKASMLAYLKRYNKKATVKTVDDIVDLVRDIANMPTGYFEAKPRRAVDFSEIKMVELPEGASDTLKAKLDENNIPYEVYGNTDQQRAEKIDKLKNVRFSMNANIEAEIDNALNNKFYRNHVKLTENTPDILLSQKGVRDLPLYMKPSHVRENIFTEQEALSKGYKIGKDINYHGLGKPKFIEVISDLDNVSEAYRGTKNAENPQRREKYFLLISKIKDADGNIINVPIYINEYADYHSVVVETNKVATVFGREGLRAYLQKEIKKGNLVRIKKKSLQVGDGTAPIAAAFGLKASDNSILNPEKKVNTSGENSSKKSENSAKRASMDADYMSAVERGDMVTAQRMVDEAAKEAGYTVKGLHATNAEFTVFDISKTSDVNYHGKGIYFTNSQRDVENNYENYEGPDPWQKIEAEAYELLYDKYGLSYEDTLTSDSEIIDKLNECYDEVIEKFKKTLRRITAYLKFDNPLVIGKGETVQDYDLSKYDGIIDKHVYENIGHSGMDENTVHYIVLNPNNIKSADPVTYDDNGNVIPLSERFNSKKSDIRYSMEPTATVESVGKSRFTEEEVKLSEKIKHKFTSLKDKLYIDTVDELWGVEKYLTKFGKRTDTAAFVQQVRAAETIAQTMIGVSQYDITNENGERLGDGVSKIFKKYHKRKLTAEFNDYLLHQLNVDRMTLHERSLAKQQELLEAYQKAQAAYDRAKRLVDLKKRKSVPREIGKALTEAKKEKIYNSVIVFVPLLKMLKSLMS